MPINKDNDLQEESDAQKPENGSAAPKDDLYKNDPGFTEQSMPNNPGAPVPPPGWQQNQQPVNQQQVNGEASHPEPNRHYRTSAQPTGQPQPAQQQPFPDANEPIFDENGFAQAYVSGQHINVTPDELSLLTSAKKMSTFAIIGAPVSLLFGGSLLSAISLVIAIIAYNKFAKVAEGHADNPEAARAIKKAGMMPIAASGLALVLNIIAAVVMFPALLQQIESSPDGIMSLFGGAGSSAVTGGGTGTQTWG